MAATLGKFTVVSAAFRKEPQRFGRPKSIIEVSVRNGTEYAIARVFFSGVYASPGRSVPWLKDTLNHAIPGGLEPGETAQWSLVPNMFNEWGELEARADAVLSLAVTRLEGPDGAPAFAATFRKDDEARQKALNAELAGLRK